MRADDMILVSVDDHICEPADMFEGHVPEKYREFTPRVVTDDRGSQQWWYGDLKGRNLAGLNFPNWTGFTGQVLNQGPDPEVNLVMVKAYNDWHVDEWCGAHPDRFIPCGILPLFDVEEAANEIRRLADKGCHAVTFSE